MEALAGIVAAEIEAAVSNEENALKELDLGIFRMPELALSYLAGRNIARAIRRDSRYEMLTWAREMSLGASGPCDLVLLRGKEPECVVEFKMADGSEAYMSDIMKLQQLGPVPIKIFCALVDAFSKKGVKDERIVRLEDETNRAGIPVRRIGSWKPFKTAQTRYASPVSCVIAIWQLDATPHLAS